jgi:alcohol dehydrogenase class IV
MNPILSFKMSGSLRFGAGAIRELPAAVAEAGGGPVLLVTDAGLVQAGIVPRVQAALEDKGVSVAVFSGVEPDPRVEIVAACVEAARAAQAKVLVGLGGGSPIDIAKVAAIILAQGGQPLDYAGVGRIPGPGLPVIAVPTTAGTGSEVTPIAVLSDKQAHLKKGLVSDYLYPRTAIVDPELAAGLPPRVTAYTGMDALTHCIEAYTNRHAHPFIDVFAEKGIELIARSIRRAYCCGEDIAARTDMALGSLYGGLCLGAVNTAAVHALAYPLGGTFDVPHGLANTVLLPHVMAFNVPADLAKYGRIAALMGEPVAGLSPRAAAEASVRACRQLAEDLGMNLRLRDFSITPEAIPAMAAGAMQVTRLMQNNPRRVLLADCEAIFRAAW